MEQNTRNVALVLSIIWAFNSMHALAAGISKQNYVSPNIVPRVSDRLIVKLRPNYLRKGLSVAQIRAELSRPFAAETVNQIQVAAGVGVTESHALSNGAHVLTMQGKPIRQSVDQAIAGIGRLANVEYVEEDIILTAQAAPDDSWYNTGPAGNPGLWGMQPASTVASPAPGGTGSYGADFETAWVTTTGTGVVVAVVDTGITQHVDIVGAGGTVSANGNLVSSGYDFIQDCRVRGTCAANTLSASAVVAPSPDATDLGDFISTADSTAVDSFFSGMTPSDSSWHGTHVAGTIAAIGNNADGVIGGAYTAKILPVRVLGKGGGYTSDIAEGIIWAAGVHPTIANPNPAKVINMSLGGTAPSCGATKQAAIDAAVAAGAVVVVAAGNENQDVANSTPANCNNVISVAAIARDGSRTAYSNYSSPATNTTNPVQVTIAAQGSDQGAYPPAFDPGILSTLNASLTTPDPAGSTYVYYQGTSMATPHAAAAVALMIARNSALTPAQVKTILSSPASLTAFPSFSTTTTNLIVPADWDCATRNNCGAGILNARLAVQNSITPLSPSSTGVDFGLLSNNATASKTVTLTNSSQGSLLTGIVTITGANAAFFNVVTNTCDTSTIMPQGTCQLTVSYMPTASGNHAATLSIPTSADGVTTAIGLTGIRESPLTATTPTVTAATVYLGDSTKVNLMFSNPNAAAVSVGVVSLSNPAIMATSVDNCSNTTLAAGATCLVTVTISPAAIGAYSGTVTVSLASGGTPTKATISGSADAAPVGGGGGGGGGGDGGGGCSLIPARADPDFSLPLSMLIMLAYWLRQRVIRRRGAA